MASREAPAWSVERGLWSSVGMSPCSPTSIIDQGSADGVATPCHRREAGDVSTRGALAVGSGTRWIAWLGWVPTWAWCTS